MTDTAETTVREGSEWERISDGRAVVRIDRVWSSEHFCGGGTFVRCHPVKGGKAWFTLIEEFLKRYKPTSTRAGEREVAEMDVSASERDER